MPFKLLFLYFIMLISTNHELNIRTMDRFEEKNEWVTPKIVEEDYSETRMGEGEGSDGEGYS